VDRYAYDVWGQPTTVTESVPQRLRYAGYWYDQELGWYWVGVRMYDPSLKRWSQPDPSQQDGVRTYPIPPAPSPTTRTTCPDHDPARGRAADSPIGRLSFAHKAGASKPCRPPPCSVEHGKNVDIAVPYTVDDNVGSVGHNQLACPVDASDASKRGMVLQVADGLLNTPQDAVGHLLADLLGEASGDIIDMTQRAASRLSRGALATIACEDRLHLLRRGKDTRGLGQASPDFFELPCLFVKVALQSIDNHVIARPSDNRRQAIQALLHLVAEAYTDRCGHGSPFLSPLYRTFIRIDTDRPACRVHLYWVCLRAAVE
jgi:RHS repeat-associated protein